MTFATVVASHFPPRAAAMPWPLSAAAISRSDGREAAERDSRHHACKHLTARLAGIHSIPIHSPAPFRSLQRRSDHAPQSPLQRQGLASLTPTIQGDPFGHLIGRHRLWCVPQHVTRGQMVLEICSFGRYSISFDRSQTSTRIASMRHDRRVVYVYRSNAGLTTGMLSVLFGILGIFTFGIIFVPLAALFSCFGFIGGLGLFRGFTDMSGTAMLASVVGGFLAWIGFLASPSLWLILGVAALMKAGSGVPSQPIARAPTNGAPAIEAPSGPMVDSAYTRNVPRNCLGVETTDEVKLIPRLSNASQIQHFPTVPQRPLFTDACMMKSISAKLETVSVVISLTHENIFLKSRLSVIQIQIMVIFLKRILGTPQYSAGNVAAASQLSPAPKMSTVADLDQITGLH